MWAEFQENRAKLGFDRDDRGAAPGPASARRSSENGIGALRGAVGTPEQMRQLLREYEEVGVDQVIFVAQAGKNRHEHICESLELFAAEVMPEFAERDPEHQKAKAERLAPGDRGRPGPAGAGP